VQTSKWRFPFRVSVLTYFPRRRSEYREEQKRRSSLSVQILRAELEERSRTIEQLEGSLAAERNEIEALNAKANDLRCVKPGDSGSKHHNQAKEWSMLDKL
jgi:predicted RNase H-like nuclease (RuvC/YqgF family)